MAPEIFFGRDELVSNIASLAVQTEQMRFALLGAGGMGKTSAVLHILHQQSVVNHYGKHRYFVCCDATTSAETLAGLILRSLPVSVMHHDEENMLNVMHQALCRMPRTLLVLDNFETLLNAGSSPTRVSDLLRRIVNAESLSLIITMRGAVPPYGIKWTHQHSLGPLAAPAAKEAFLAINPLFAGGDESNDNRHDLEELLAEMDYVPLAIRLLASVSIGFSPQYILRRWKKEKIAMLSTGDGSLENIEVSIRLSITALDVTNNSEAVQLLGVLSQLPDGLLQWEERLPLIATGFQNVHRSFHLLHKAALVFIWEGAANVLSPIRHYVNRYHPPDPHHVRCLESYFWDLVHTHTTEAPLSGFICAKDILEADIGNIHSLIIHAARSCPSAQVVDAALEICEFLYRTNPSTELLYEVIALVKQVRCPIKKAQLYGRFGNFLHMRNIYFGPSDTSTEARDHFLDVDDVLDAAQSALLRLQEDTNIKATDMFIDPLMQFLNVGFVIGVAHVLVRVYDSVMVWAMVVAWFHFYHAFSLRVRDLRLYHYSSFYLCACISVYLVCLMSRVSYLPVLQP
jgi:hypothetical protein